MEIDDEEYYPREALILSHDEWDQLANICRVFKGIPMLDKAMPKESELVDRILETFNV